MQKILAAFLVVIFISLISFSVVHAAVRGFGGKIVNIDENIQEIMEAKNDGYTCVLGGHVIEVKPRNSEITIKLFIPSFLALKNRHTLRINQGILGGYYRETPIPCIKTKPFGVRFLRFNTVTTYGLQK